MVRLSARAAATLVLGLLVAAFAAGPASAQPAPSFEAACGELRTSIDRLGGDGEESVTISVRGRLTAVRSDGALVYLFMCAPPDPRVLCVTYQTNGSVAGDEVIFSGNLIPRGPDHVQLDPCLHHRRNKARSRPNLREWRTGINP